MSSVLHMCQASLLKKLGLRMGLDRRESHAVAVAEDQAAYSDY